MASGSGGPRGDAVQPRRCPRTVDFADELPRDPNGKLYKRLLRDRYWTGHASRVI